MEELKRFITKQIEDLTGEARRLESYIEDRQRVANDGYYVAYARNKARQEADHAKDKLLGNITTRIDLADKLKRL